MQASSPLLISQGTSLYRDLLTLAREARAVFFTGLPGTGKSLLLHQFAHLAVGEGRTVHLLQWDVARPRFEASRAGQRYPVVNGVTHGIIRKAVGLWARQALPPWHRQHPDAMHLLIGETPFIGNRLIELARAAPDDAEQLLRQPTWLFVIPVPSRDVRAHIERTRQQRSRAPLHPQEAEDAPPRVLETLWHEIYQTAPYLGVATRAIIGTSPPPFDPVIYQQVYQALLRHRHYQALILQTLLPTSRFSPYRFTVPTHALSPSAIEIANAIQEIERRFPDPQRLHQSLVQWYRIMSEDDNGEV